MFENLSKSFKSLVQRVSQKELKPENLQTILWEFKLALIQNNVAVSVTDHIIEEIKNRLTGTKIGRLMNHEKLVQEVLRTVLFETLELPGKKDLFEFVKQSYDEKTPCVIVFVGINGTGKTTTIAKIAQLILNRKFSVVIAGSDTFRAGSIEQIETHAKRLGVPLIKHQYGSDAAAVAFDAIEYAKARGVNVVLVDTAGRMQTNKNLLMEMQKIIRVVNPDLVIFVGDALAGNDVVSQAEDFIKSIRIDGSILTKIDADTKGGAAISISYVTKRPILYLGTGQRYGDLEQFEPEKIVNRILNTS